MFNLLKFFPIAVWLQLLQLTSVKCQGYVPVIPPECEDLGYCDKPIPDYPQQHVDEVIKESGLDNAKPEVIDATKQSRRQDPTEQKLCASDSRTIIPKVAKDTSGKWMYLVNSPQTFQQAFIVEICSNANSACSPVVHVNTGYAASCQQNFISKVLVALDAEGKKTENKFKIPSNCYCQVKEST